VVNCPLCGSSATTLALEARDANLRTSGEAFTIFLCRSCGTGFTDPRAQRMEMARLYPSGYQPYISHAPPWYGRSETRRKIKGALDRSTGYYALANPQLIRPEEMRTDPGFVWEIGCGIGELLGQFKARGWRVLGVEPSETAARIARENGLTVEVRRAEDATLPPERADVILLNHSLEHMADLDAVLRKCREALKPDGSLIIAVPNFDSPGRRFFGGAWIHLDVPRHFYHFTPEGLQQLLAKYGFRAQRLQFDNSLEAVVTSMRNMIRTRSLKVGPPPSRGGGAMNIIERLEGRLSRLSVVSCLSAPMIPILEMTRSYLKSSMVIVFKKS
jgi:SAM-dependent methyltransferase